MKTKMALLVEKWFPWNIYVQLIEKGFKKIEEKTWIVPVDKIREFEKITGINLMYQDNMHDGKDEIIEARIMRKNRNTGKEISYYLEDNNYYVTLTDGHRRFVIPIEIVEAYFDVVRMLKIMGIKRIKKRELVAKVLERLGITKYFSPDGKRFFWESFYGDRTRYHTHYYVPAKILEAKNVIRITQHDDIIIL